MMHEIGEADPLDITEGLHVIFSLDDVEKLVLTLEATKLASWDNP